MDKKKYSPAAVQSMVITASVVLLAVIIVTILTLTGGSHQVPPDAVESDTLTPDTDRRPVIRPPVTDDVGGETDRPTLLPPADSDDLPTVAPIVWGAPLERASLDKGHDMTVQVYSQTMNDYRVHCGVDLRASIGDDVMCVADGVIQEIRVDPFEGQCLRVAHENGYVSVYKNLAPDLVEGLKVGDSVMRGQTLASVGESAIIEIADEAHLHLGLYHNGKPIDPLSCIPHTDAQGEFEG